jgi:hypothetical protein
VPHRRTRRPVQRETERKLDYSATRASSAASGIKEGKDAQTAGHQHAGHIRAVRSAFHHLDELGRAMQIDA